MPPVKFKLPQQVRIRCPKGRIVPLREPDIKLGRSVVAAAPHRVTADQLENARRILRRFLGRSKEYHMDVHATYPVTKKPEGVKMGQGKGSIEFFVARVPAGRTVMHIPQLSAFQSIIPQIPNYRALRAAASQLPFSVVLRQQNNSFPMDNVQRLVQAYRAQQEFEKTQARKERLCPRKIKP